MKVKELFEDDIYTKIAELRKKVQSETDTEKRKQLAKKADELEKQIASKKK